MYIIEDFDNFTLILYFTKTRTNFWGNVHFYNLLLFDQEKVVRWPKNITSGL